MKNIKYIAFVIVLFFASCDEGKFSQIKTIDLPEHTPKLAVTTRLQTQNTLPRVFVSHSQAILDETDYEKIDNATVNIFKDDMMFMEFTWDESFGNYNSPGFSPDFVPGTYRMEVTAPGYDPVQATQVVPINCEVVNAEYKKDAFTNEWGEKSSILEVEIKDDASEENFYSMSVVAIGTDPNGAFRIMEAYGYSEDLLMEYGYEEEFIPDATFNGGNYVFRYFIDYDLDQAFQVDQGGTLDELIISIHSYSKDFYRYDVSRETYNESQDIPFIEPVLITTNWDNGFGIFSIQNVEKYKLEF